MKVISYILFIVLISLSSSSLLADEMTSQMTNFHGLNISEVIEKLGIPERCETFLMKQVVGEFRVELLNTYPITKRENQNVPIKELHWKDGNYNITLWFHQVNGKWVVLNSRRWHKDIEF
jgi:hypothetical protein